MPTSRVTPRAKKPELSQDAIEKAQAGFFERGESVADWARERGYNRITVYSVLRGERRCIRGLSHKIAVDLGIKVAPHASKPAKSKAENHHLIAVGE